MIRTIRKNCRALFCEPDGTVWVACGLCFFCIDKTGSIIGNKYSVGNVFQRFFSRFRILRQGLRIGIHHLIVLHNGNILVCTKRSLILVDRKTGKILNNFSDFIGNKPAHQGICVDEKGSIYFGEYSLNKERQYPISLLKSDDGGLTFYKVFSFVKRTIRHIHFITYDYFEKCLWLGTGDNDNECFLMKSVDGGHSWQTIGSGNQLWRAIGICVTERYLFWGTDAGHVNSNNYFLKFDKKTGTLEKIFNSYGPCHGSAIYFGNKIFLSTGVEGGKNEHDRIARLYSISDDMVECVYTGKKDIFPFVIQYGVFRFPLNTACCKNVFCTMMGLKHGGESVIIYEKE